MPVKSKKLLMVISISTLLCVIMVGIYITQGYISKYDDLPLDKGMSSEVVNYQLDNKPEKVISNPTAENVSNGFIAVYSDNINQAKDYVLTTKNQLGEDYIYIPYEDAINHVVVTDLYRSKSLKINVLSKVESSYKVESIERVQEGATYTSINRKEKTPINGYELYTTSEIEEVRDVVTSTMNEISWNIDKQLKSDPLSQIAYKKTVEMTEVNHEFIFQMDQVYVPNIYVDESGIYISLIRPDEAYDKIIVIDAGHGGKDSGAIGVDDIVLEKDLNLKIVKYMKELLEEDRIKVYYTRLEDETIYLQPRVSFANEINADLFLSIHYNASEYESASGSEVLYNERDASSFTSEEFATFCLDELSAVTKNVNRGLVEGYEMLIIRSAKMPAVLVEVGFVTNQKELKFLIDENNQKRIAKGLVEAIRSSFLEIENGNVLEIDMK